MSPVKNIASEVIKNFVFKHLFPERYLSYAKADIVRGRVVFLEVREESLTDNFKPICYALRKRNAELGPVAHYSMITVLIREGMESRASVLRNCLRAIPAIATAQFVFVNDSSRFLSCLPLRRETCVIQTWHACGAFKKFGYSAVGKGFGIDRKEFDSYPYHKNFSYVTVSSPEVVWAYAEAFNMEDRRDCILPIGVSRTDIFFNRKFREKAFGKTAWVLKRSAPSLFREFEGGRLDDGKTTGTDIVPGRKIILYAPTYRGNAGHALSPDRLDIPAIKREFGSTHVLLINHHPFVKSKNRPPVPDSCRDFAFDMTGMLSIEELLTVADVCITDYSSIIFEYSLFEKPIIFYAFDLEDYNDERGFYYPISDMMSGPVCKSTQEIISVLKDLKAGFDLERIRTFKYRFMGSCDGHSTQRLLDLMDRWSAGDVKAQGNGSGE